MACFCNGSSLNQVLSDLSFPGLIKLRFENTDYRSNLQRRQGKSSLDVSSQLIKAQHGLSN